MNLSTLLANRQALLKKAQLANKAYWFSVLDQLGRRAAAANLNVRVKLLAANPDEDRCDATLIALDRAQSLIEEHFTDKDILLMADGIAFAIDADFSEIEFNLEDLSQSFAASLRSALESAGVLVEQSEQNLPSRRPE